MTYTPPIVYQLPASGMPDTGLEVYLWPDGNIDCFLHGRSIPHQEKAGLVIVSACPSPAIFDTKTQRFYQ